jgi:ABC-type transport system involved in cytochrome c biogenesis permease component
MWVLADSWTIARRTLAHWRNQPGLVIFQWFFPVLMLLMFGGLLGGAMESPDGSSYYELLVPGIFALAMLFGLEGTMTAVTTDVSKGVTDRFRSLPMSSTAVVLGRCIADMLDSVVTLLVLVATGLALGWRWHEGLPSALAAFGLLLLLRFALLWVGIFIGLTVKNAQSVTMVQVLVWPIRRHVDDARLAGHDRPMESTVVHSHGVPRLVRQPRPVGHRNLDRDPCQSRGGHCPVADDGNLPAVVRTPLPHTVTVITKVGIGTAVSG